MSDIIHLLPDSVANQIAAGEVVQRPSSVVKELLENSIDAEATEIELWLTDAGKSCIQVIDNGKGMTETDARLSFERHATSKISQADDLFNLTTMGFRGEALASIAAVAQVELKTRTEADEMGVCILVEGARCVDQHLIQCAVGANFAIRNLFYNLPARRRFLKSNTTEFNNVMQEFERVALINPHVGFKLYKDDTLMLNLKVGSFKQRILGLFGNTFDKQLLPVSVNTNIVKIEGFTVTPQNAKQKGYKQFFFVNGRYMRHPYFNKAVMAAYERLIPSDKQVSFFLKLTVPPTQIDVNIHPTKTEIKFEDDHAIWQMLLVAVRDALAKYNAVPLMDFDGVDEISIPSFHSDDSLTEPRVAVNKDFNPFESTGRMPSYRTNSAAGWQPLYQFSDNELPTTTNKQPTQSDCLLDFDKKNESNSEQQISQPTSRQCIQYDSRYILTPIEGGLMIVDFVRAHRRILYDQFMQSIQSHNIPSQTLMFPELIQLTVSQSVVMDSLIDDINATGFEITSVGGGSFSVSAIPAVASNADYNALLIQLIDDYDKQGLKLEDLYHNLAMALCRSNAMNVGQRMDGQEMTALIAQLLICESPNYGPDGKVIISVMPAERIRRLF